MNVYKIVRPTQILTPAITLSTSGEFFDNLPITESRRTFRTNCAVLRNYYDILGLTPRASQAHVKSAYYRLSKQFHPDVNSSEDAKKKFAEISEAYETLGNRAKRRLYDGVTHAYRGGMQSAVRAKRVDVEYEEFAKRAGQFKQRPGAPPTGRTAHFNFDEFYRQHYGQVLHDTRELRAKKEKFSREMQERNLANQGNKIVLHLSALLAVITAFVITQAIRGDD